MTDIQRKGDQVLSTFIDALNWDQAINKITDWGQSRKHRSVCLCNVHSSVTATTDKKLADALSKSDMVLPDGAPVAWVLRRKGFKNQPRIAGPDLMLKLCDNLQKTDIGIFLFGSSEQTLSKLQTNLNKTFPELKIAGCLSPKYGTWSQEEEQQYIGEINDSGAGIIFIGLGCPKQEIWMVNNKEKVKGVMLGVGAAFDFHAGTIKRAPSYMQKAGLEWLHRLFSEPGRLWKRYFITNTQFIYFVAKDLLKN